jgi:hypothetical protein
MTREINDWKKVIKSLIKILVQDGFEPYKANNGEDSITSDHMGRLAEKIDECDEGNLFIRKGDFKARLYIILGNEPCELVADIGYNGDMTELDQTLDKFYNAWEGKPCPKKTVKN